MSRVKVMQKYVEAHRQMKLLAAAGDVKADEVRDRMDKLWDTMSAAEQALVRVDLTPIVVKDTGKKWKEVSALDAAMKRSGALAKERRAFKKLDEVMREHAAVDAAASYIRRHVVLFRAAGGQTGIDLVYDRAETKLFAARSAWARAVGALAKLEVENKP